MDDEDAPSEKPKLKGSPKGGSRYPRHKLGDVLPWAKKLVSKTHLAPQPLAIVLSGVVGAISGVGKVRVSSLRQFGLLEGESAGISATELSKDIAASPPDELPPLLRKAVLTPTVFRALFDTFHGDETTRAKLMQRAAALKVHPEETEKCVENYIGSLVVAGLIKVDGDKVSHLSAVDANSLPDGLPEDPGAELEPRNLEQSDQGIDAPDEEADTAIYTPHRKPSSAAVTINIAIDSSLDTEKLEKQLSLLKKYGAL